MSANYVLTTDSNSEILVEWQDQYQIPTILMPYSIDGTEYEYDLGRNTDIHAFYDRMRAGAVAITMQRNTEEFKAFWKPFLDEGKDILYVGFSSQLSGTYQSAVMARDEIAAEYPDRKILLVDSLLIAGPLGLLVLACAQRRAEGASIEEVYAFAEDQKRHYNVVFCVENLVYLKRGGRLTGAAAFFGTLLDVKPMIYIDPDGKLVPLEKVRGRKKALKRLCEIAVRHADGPHFHVIHGDCQEEVDFVSKLLREIAPDAQMSYNDLGPVTGAHAGPGTIGICYTAKDRNPLAAPGK